MESGSKIFMPALYFSTDPNGMFTWMTSLDFFLPESVGAEATEERGREDDGVRKVAEDIDRLDGTAAAEEDARRFLTEGVMIRPHRGCPKRARVLPEEGGREVEESSHDCQNIVFMSAQQQQKWIENWTKKWSSSPKTLLHLEYSGSNTVDKLLVSTRKRRNDNTRKWHDVASMFVPEK